MLIQFDKSTRVAYGATSDHSRLDMRGDGGNIPRNPSFLFRCGAALRDVAAIAAAILLICATGIGFTAAIYLLLFVRF